MFSVGTILFETISQSLAVATRESGSLVWLACGAAAAALPCAVLVVERITHRHREQDAEAWQQAALVSSSDYRRRWY
jgi:hypothetical protein